MNRWVKRVALLAMLALFVAPLSAYAAETYELDLTVEVDGSNVTATATVKGAESAESGNWKIVPVGKGKPATSEQSSELSFSHTWEDLEPGEYCFKAHYNGKLDGATAETVLDVKGKQNRVCVTVGSDESKEEETTDGEETPKEEESDEEDSSQPPAVDCTDLDNISEEDIHEITIDMKDGDDAITVTAKLPGTNVDGAWEFMVGPWDAEEPTIYETKVASENTVTFSIPKDKLGEDDYLVLIVFSGTIDGKECQWGIGLDGFYLEDEEEGTIAPPTKEVPKPKTPEGKERVIENAKGGKMPNTSASMVTHFAFGALLMVAGAGLLVYRRFNLA